MFEPCLPCTRASVSGEGRRQVAHGSLLSYVVSPQGLQSSCVSQTLLLLLWTKSWKIYEKLQEIKQQEHIFNCYGTLRGSGASLGMFKTSFIEAKVQVYQKQRGLQVYWMSSTPWFAGLPVHRGTFLLTFLRRAKCIKPTWCCIGWTVYHHIPLEYSSLGPANLSSSYDFLILSTQPQSYYTSCYSNSQLHVTKVQIVIMSVLKNIRSFQLSKSVRTPK